MTKKRRAIFRQMHIRKASIAFLQETYSKAAQENIWKTEWGGKIYFNHGSNHSKGVAILFDPRLPVIVRKEIKSDDGRILILETDVDNERVVLVNIYTPNTIQAQQNFFIKLAEMLRSFSNSYIVIGGDFNCPLSNEDKVGGKNLSSKKNVIAKINHTMGTYDLVDVWRYLHPKNKQWTWSSSDKKIKCRLDYWLISRDNLRNVNSSEIEVFPHCDHSAVTLHIALDKQHSRGPGYWKFNSSLLEDKNFVEQLSTKIPSFIQQYQEVSDKGLLWELIKMEIRAFTMNFAKQKAKNQRDYELELIKKAQKVKRKLAKRESKEAMEEHDKIIKELDYISFQRTRGACLRSKARWFERGERSSKYFLNLEKRNYQNMVIKKLIKDDDCAITDPSEILKEQQKFYETLYESQNPAVNDPKFNSFFNNDRIVKLNNDQKQKCEGQLTVNECLAALRTFNKNKSPGTDGLTAEFYLCFWKELGQVMVDSFNYAFAIGHLSISQRQGIIRLIPKKDKDPLYLKNWRPLSLLNVDYKIATKVLALRLKKILPLIISSAQTGYVEGRFIGQNIRLISDILSFTAEQNIEGIATFIDFEKAFDSLEWEFLSKAIETYNFGNDFKRWVKVIYHNISSCTINNGFSSPFFSLYRGVRQGCPLSGMLFILAVEILSCAIRSDHSIVGIQVKEKEIKLAQYADDTTTFVKDGFSLGRLLELLNQFEECSGLKINPTKSEAIWLGKNRNSIAKLYDLKWPREPVTALGTAFSYDSDKCEVKNFHDKATKIQKMFNLWSQRDLSLYGKITIAKTLGLSKMIFSSACLPTPPHIVLKVDKMVSAFVWNNKPAKIKRESMIGPKEEGGLDLPDYDSIKKSLSVAWVKRMIEGCDQDWMAIPSFYLNQVGGTFIFECNYEVSLLDLEGLPEFYINVLRAWSEVKNECSPEDWSQVRDEILWNNKNITIEGKSIYYRDWHAVGIERVKDLLSSENKFMSFHSVIQKVGKRFPFTKLLGLIHAIPYVWKQILRAKCMVDNETQHCNKVVLPPAKKISCKHARRILVARKFKEPLANNRLRRLGVEDIEKINEIHSLSFRMTKETKLNIFQFKLIHNILPHRALLHKMKIVDSSSCLDCGEEETLRHLIVSCPSLSTFWSKVFSWWNSNSTCVAFFDEIKILYGYNAADSKFFLLNYYILIAKFYIFKQKTDAKPPAFPAFLVYLKEKMLIHRAAAIANRTLENFKTRWTTLLSLLSD